MTGSGAACEITRRRFSWTLSLAVLAVPLTACAQSERVYRIGWLGTAPLEEQAKIRPGALVLWEAFIQGLREHGWVEHKNIVFEHRHSRAKIERYPLRSVSVRAASDLEPALAEIVRAKPQALLTLSDPLTLEHQRRIVAFATKHHLPLISEVAEFAEVGALMTYGASLPALFRRAAFYVDRILRGAQPDTLPVEQPTRFDLVINLQTAKALGLTIPPSVLLRADRVIQ